MGHFDPCNIPDRRESDSVKWDRSVLKQICGNPDALPFWVADMDFLSPPEVIEALHERVSHGVFGYIQDMSEVYELFTRWTWSRHRWPTEAAQLCITPGIISALSCLVNVFTREGDRIIIQTPAYRPFFSVIRENRREVAENPLRYQAGRYTLDLDHLESLMKAPSAAMMIFCSPHNPSGRVWTRAELEEVDALAKRYHVLVVSDEIHADMSYRHVRHIPYSSLSESAAPRSVTCMAPSKTFNIPGEHFSCIVIPDAGMKKRFASYLKRISINTPTILSRVAAEAAYRHGAPWLDGLIAHLEDQSSYIDRTLSEASREILYVKPEASFIAFIDCREVEKRLNPGEDLVQVLGTKGGIALHRGSWFGRDGSGFVRLNFGTSRALLQEGLVRFIETVRTI